MKSTSSVVLVLWLIFNFSVSLKIDVWNDSVVVHSYSDPYSSVGDRSFMIPDKGLKGMLRYPVPRNACSSVEVVDNETWIAFVTDYLACPGSNDEHLEAAGYVMMIALIVSEPLSLRPDTLLPQALVDTTFGSYLEANILAVNDSSYLEVTDHFPALFEELFLIIGVILVVAILASMAVFCCSVGCQWLYQKWKHRGLSQWRVRCLPKRKYRAHKDSSEACSICLEEFKEGDVVRVLPCEHMFHPACVDEWLRKWQRTCPLCKKAISRRGQPATAAETQPLLSEEQGNYGSMGSSLESVTPEDDRQGDRPQAAIVELS